MPLAENEALLDAMLFNEKKAVEPPINTVVTPKQAKTISKSIITGGFAKSQAGRLEDKRSNEEKLDALLEGEKPGRMPVVDQELVEKSGGVKTAEEKLSELLDDKVKTGFQKYSPPKGWGERALGTLSLDSNLVIKGISEAIGLPDKDDIMDYTGDALLGDLGFREGAMRTVTGLALDIGLAPTTYLSFGTTGPLKLLGKGGKVVLNKKGLKLVNEIVEENAEKKLAGVLASKTQKGEVISEETQRLMFNSYKNEIREDVYKKVQKKFGSIDETNKNLRLGKKIEALPENIVDKGGVKLSVPFTDIETKLYEAGDIYFGGKKVLDGAQVAKRFQQTGIPGLTRSLLEQAEATKLGGKISNVIETEVEVMKSLKDKLGKAFVYGYKAPVELLNLFNDNLMKAKGVDDKVVKEVTDMFKGFDQKELDEFSQIMFNATTAKDKLGVISQALPDSPKVRSKIEAWLGGKFIPGGFKKTPGQKGIQDVLADKLNLTDKERLDVWMPLVAKKFGDKPSFKFTGEPGDYSFAAQRSGKLKDFKTNAMEALIYKGIQKGYANLHDDLYKEIISKKIGDALPKEQWLKLPDAEKALYKPLIPSYAETKAFGELKLPEAYTDRRWYAKKGTVDSYNELVQDTATRIPVLHQFNKFFKPLVTKYFPSFHFRNHNSNIVLNAYRIGRHALPLVGKEYSEALNLVKGKNLDKVMPSLNMTGKEILEEASKFGALKGNFLFDLGGEGLSSTKKGGLSERAAWQGLFSSINPFSTGEKGLGVFTEKLGRGIEDQARLVNYLTWRKKGLSPRLAAMEANEALFDYGAITNFERTMVDAIPFYTFRRKNLENHMKILAHRPGTLGAMLKFFQSLSPTKKEQEGLPDRASKYHSVKLGNAIISGLGLPIEDVINMAGLTSGESDVLSGLNPVLRFSGEKLFGKDMWSGRDVSSINNANEFRFLFNLANDKKLPTFISGPAKEVAKFFKLEEDRSNRKKLIGDPDRLHMLRNLPTSRFQSTFAMLQKEDIPMMEFAARYLTGLVKVDPDIRLKASTQKNPLFKKSKEVIEETGSGRVLQRPIIFGGDRPTTRFINRMLDKIEKGTPEQQEEAYRRLKERLEEKQERRVGN